MTTTHSNNNIARAIYLASKDKPKAEQILIFKKVAKFLFRRQLLTRVPDILLQLGRVINVEENRIIAKASSFRKLDQEEKSHLEHLLKRRYGAKEIYMLETIDEKLLGGLKLEINDEVIDFSIQNKIKKLQEHLIKSA